MSKDDMTAVVRTYSTRQTAEFGKMILAGSGIDAFIRGDDAGGMRPLLTPVTGVRLVVRSDDLERADDVLRESESKSQEEQIADQ